MPAIGLGLGLQFILMAGAAAAGGAPLPDTITWQSDDLNWYETTFVADVVDGETVVVPVTNQTPVAAGTDPYIVFEFGVVNHKVALSTEDGVTDIWVDPVTTVEVGVPTLLVEDQNGATRVARLDDDNGQPVFTVT